MSLKYNIMTGEVIFFYVTSKTSNLRHMIFSSLKNASCQRQFSSYRSTVTIPSGKWTKVRLPWAKFEGYGWGAVENNFDPSSLRRLGIVSIGKELVVTLAMSSVGFYRQD